VKEKYASPEKVFAMGGSAGGLLMGAISNMAPDLYTGIIAQVPFVDVVTTMLDESIPLTTGEYDEWGNPNVKKYYDYMLSYSPYDNVEAKEYPNMLITTGLHDSQVQYWEPAKWVAKLRDLKTDDNLLLIHINMDFGHGGASGRFEVYKEYALEYAFIFKILNIKK
jgi:oligopeptidase B